MAEIHFSGRASLLLGKATECCNSYRHEFVMPEHLLYALSFEQHFIAAFDQFDSHYVLCKRLEEFFDHIESVDEEVEYTPEASAQLNMVLDRAADDVAGSSGELIDLPHLVEGLFNLKESWAAYLLKESVSNMKSDFMSRLIEVCDNEIEDTQIDEDESQSVAVPWRNLVTCMNDSYQEHNRILGREKELIRTIQVLCRKDKNNPIHVGEPGVGKTALVWGLARLVAEGNVPERLKGCRIYQLDMGTLLAGTQYRGDMEKRIKQIMDGILEESDKNIVYIDEIHTLVGAGTTSENALDASSMLKPYLESGKIRFIGSTTFDEYNRFFSRSKGLVRRFQQIDILEPSVDETKYIISQLLPSYEEFHHVKYADEAVSFAVDASARHINDRFLPDKAIDLIDEAGAAMETAEVQKIIEKKEIADVLSKICKVDALSEECEDDCQRLESLERRMLTQIYGQDAAIRQVVEAVQMSRAGLLDDNKPLASFLFVGPTGVGKTEVAKNLSHEMGISLIRFDMSEYAEKHAVAKLIGSPAGYVGYEDGGLLTDAIRKNPNSVLLLDEIEKAHQDVCHRNSHRKNTTMKRKSYNTPKPWIEFRNWEKNLQKRHMAITGKLRMDCEEGYGYIIM